MKTDRFFILSIVTAFCICTCSTAFAAKKIKAQQQAATQEQAAQEDEEPAAPSKSKVQTIAKSPYIGAILIDAATGKVLFEDNADAKGYPASVIKLMDLMIILDGIRAKSLTLQDKITVTAAASKIGGSQVYLKENEVFTVDDLLYALMIQSANDAAVALALHYAGTTDAFVEMMNKKAQELGMKNTVFHSVHGLPPGKDQQPDASTPRDIAKLCVALLKNPDVLRYTSIKERPFRTDSAQPFIMRNHNHLLGGFEGCDGFKTGYYRAAGYSIAATATKKGVRAIAVVFGSIDRKMRDAKARELLAKGLAELARNAPPASAVPVASPLKQAQPETEAVAPESPSAPDNGSKKNDVVQISKKNIKIGGIILVVVFILWIIVTYMKNKKRKSSNF